ncbi:hypothetical protein H8959_012747 [Pygathrix nigripes]
MRGKDVPMGSRQLSSEGVDKVGENGEWWRQKPLPQLSRRLQHTDHIPQSEQEDVLCGCGDIDVSPTWDRRKPQEGHPRALWHLSCTLHFPGANAKGKARHGGQQALCWTCHLLPQGRGSKLGPPLSIRFPQSPSEGSGT